MAADTSTQRISHIELDESSIIRRNADIEHERQVAIFDLLEDNLFAPRGDLDGGHAGPFNLRLRMEDNRLVFDLSTEDNRPLNSFTLPLTPFKKIIKEYFLICDSYYTAIKSASPRQIEAIDMGRRGLHNEGSELLMERLAEKVELDMDTARRLFTLICVLQIR